MKKLLLLLLISFLSSSSLAKVGDMYYCEMIQHISTEKWWELKVENRELVRFKFKREEDYFTIFSDREDVWPANGIYEYTWRSQENDDFFGNNLWGLALISYSSNKDSNSGFFNFVYSYPKGMFAVLAHCEIY